GDDRAEGSAFGDKLMQAGAGFPMGLQEFFHAAAQVRLAGAGPVQESRPLVGGVVLHRLQENRFCPMGVRVHAASLSILPGGTCERGAENVSGKTKTHGGSGRSRSTSWSLWGRCLMSIPSASTKSSTSSGRRWGSSHRRANSLATPAGSRDGERR